MGKRPAAASAAAAGCPDTETANSSAAAAAGVSPSCHACSDATATTKAKCGCWLCAACAKEPLCPGRICDPESTLECWGCRKTGLAHASIGGAITANSFIKAFNEYTLDDSWEKQDELDTDAPFCPDCWEGEDFPGCVCANCMRVFPGYLVRNENRRCPDCEGLIDEDAEDSEDSEEEEEEEDDDEEEEEEEEDDD